MYPTINRAVAIIKPKAPFIQWLKSLPDWDLDVTLEDLRKDSTAILIQEQEEDRKAIKYIEKIHQEIFELELDSWHRDEQGWPKKRDLKTFRKWFDVEIYSMVIDTGKGMIVKE